MKAMRLIGVINAGNPNSLQNDFNKVNKKCPLAIGKILVFNKASLVETVYRWFIKKSYSDKLGMTE
jgi:hypothetical protein